MRRLNWFISIWLWNSIVRLPINIKVILWWLSGLHILLERSIFFFIFNLNSFLLKFFSFCLEFDIVWRRVRNFKLLHFRLAFFYLVLIKRVLCFLWFMALALGVLGFVRLKHVKTNWSTMLFERVYLTFSWGLFLGRCLLILPVKRLHFISLLWERRSLLFFEGRLLVKGILTLRLGTTWFVGLKHA